MEIRAIRLTSDCVPSMNESIDIDLDLGLRVSIYT